MENPAPSPQIPGGLVIGGDYQGLSIVRSLGRKGIPVCVIDDVPSISRFSRYANKSVRVDDLRDEAGIICNLLDIGESLNLRGWVIYPTRDEQVAAIARHRKELAQFFRVPTPEWETIRWAWDKRLTYQRATELDMAIPRTFYPKSFEDLKNIDFPPPYAIKPAIKENFIYSTHAKAWRANSLEELDHLCRKAAEIIALDEVMVQEFITGGGDSQFSYCAFFRDGCAVGKMVACRRRQHPLEFGRASTFVETIESPPLEELAERFLRSIDYYGLVEVEFKRDPRDSQFKLLDVNARTWGYHSLGARAGVDFSYMLHCDQIGAPGESHAARPGVSWMRFVTDLPTAVISCWSGQLRLDSYLTSLRTGPVEAVFALKDPLPGLAELWLVGYLALKRGFVEKTQI